VEIKQFTAPTVAAAAAQARRAMGPDAVVLQARRIAGRGWRRYLRRFDQIQLTMAVDVPTPAARAPRGAGAAPRPAPEAASAAVRPASEPGRELDPPAPAGAGAAPRPAPEAASAAARPASEPGRELHRPRLVLTEPAEQEAVRERLRRAQATGRADLGPPQPVCPRPGSRRLVVLVGPTGAGKTTTAAKLAALLQMQQGWRVVLISADTFRVGAVEQLGAYARLLGTPLEVAATPRALERALPRCADADVIIVDTAGRGHRDRGRMDELAVMLAAARSLEPEGTEVHLVLPATLAAAEAEAVVAAYRGLGAERLLPTKLDECEDPARLLDLASRAAMPLSYWTAGQRVPEDIAVAWPDELVAWAEDARRVSS
jgi:flagellar biosynthesis protein FlhF